MSKTPISVGLSLAALLVLAAGAAPDLSGTWTGQVVMPEGSEDALTLVLARKDAVYSGTISDTAGLCFETPLRDVTFEGTALGFEFATPGGGKIRCEMKLEGGRLVGRWNDFGGGTDIAFDRVS